MVRVSDHLQATILGWGSSGGVPRLGGVDGSGDWGACDPANPKNRRRRCSLLLRRGDTTVLVDTSPDMREQLLAARVLELDAVLMPHPHADQTNGIDDLRPLTFIMSKRVEMYADTESLEHLMRQFSYCFVTPLGTEYPPIITGHAIPEPFSPFEIHGAGGPIPVLAFWQAHGPVRSLGFRFGNLAYSSDVSGLDDTAFSAPEGVGTWIGDAPRVQGQLATGRGDPGRGPDQFRETVDAPRAKLGMFDQHGRMAHLPGNDRLAARQLEIFPEPPFMLVSRIRRLE